MKRQQFFAACLSISTLALMSLPALALKTAVPANKTCSSSTSKIKCAKIKSTKTSKGKIVPVKK